MENKDIVKLENITKIYDTQVKALDNISFTVDKGEIFGFLGPNGAGKTTAVKLLNGILSPNTGVSSVFGINPVKNPVEIHKISGVVTEHAQMYGYLTGYENLVFYGKLFGLLQIESEKRANILLEQIGLGDSKDKKLDTYSTGMRQRLSLARAMIHKPSILFLDEPTSGLDPESIKDVNSMIKRLANEENVTVFLCTHQLRYAEEICTYYGLIDKGKILANGDINTLRKKAGGKLTLEIKTNLIPPDIKGIKEKDIYKISISSEKEIPEIVRKIVEFGGDISHVSAYHLSLEDIYFTLLSKEKSISKNGGGEIA